MKRFVPFLLLAFVAVACQDEGPTVPVDGPQLDKWCVDPPCKGGKPDDGGVEYEFVYAEAYLELGSECWKSEIPDPHEWGFYCAPSNGDPKFWLRVLGDDQPVETGTVKFQRCEDADGNPLEYLACCCLRPGKPDKNIRRVEYVVPVTISADGEWGWFDASPALTNWQYSIGPIAGMRWGYNADGKGPADLTSSPTWQNFMEWSQ